MTTTLRLEDIEPIAIAAHIEELDSGIAKPSVKQNLAAIRQLFDYLVTGGVLLSTPAGSVRVLFNATIRNRNTRMA
jgi:site-specific recombinase XerD